MTRTRRLPPWGWCAMAAWLRGTAPPPPPQHTRAHRYVHLTDGPLTGADRDAALADATLSDAGCAQLLGVTVAEAQRLRAVLLAEEKTSAPPTDALSKPSKGGAEGLLTLLRVPPLGGAENFSAVANDREAALPPAGGQAQVGETLALVEARPPGGGAISTGEGGPDRTWSHP